MSKLEETSTRKLVQALYGAAFRQGELEHRDGVSNATLTKNSEEVEAAKNAIVAEVQRLSAACSRAQLIIDGETSLKAGYAYLLDIERAKVAKLRKSGQKMADAWNVSTDAAYDAMADLLTALAVTEGKS